MPSLPCPRLSSLLSAAMLTVGGLLSLPTTLLAKDAVVLTNDSMVAAVAEATDRRDVTAPIWAQALASRDPVVLVSTARGLGRIGGEAQLEQLLPLFQHANPEVRSEAAFAVGILGVETAAIQTLQEQFLLKQLLSEPQTAVRQTLLRALGNSGGNVAQQALRDYRIGSLSAAERAAWAQAVGLLWSYRRGALASIDAALVKQLLTLTTRDEPVAEMAAFALARARKEPLIPQQAAALKAAFGKSPSAGARIFLLRALATSISEKNADHWLRAQQRGHLAGRKFSAAERVEVQTLLAGNLTGKSLRTAVANALRQPTASERLAVIQALSTRPADATALRDVLQAHADLHAGDRHWLAPLLLPPPGAEAESTEGSEPVSATPAYGEAMKAVGRRYRLHTLRGPIDIELLPDAIYSAANFAQLADRGYYNGTVFHRVIGNFVAQGGDPTGTGEGGPGWRIREELSQRPHAPGYVGMATAGKDTGGSQFFINTGRNPHLDWHYTIFAKVLTGQVQAEQLLPGDALFAVSALE